MARDLPTANLPEGTFHRRYILSKNERIFFDALNRAFGKYSVVFPKVRLCDIIRNTCSRDFNRICSKHVDFLICNRKTLNPQKVIELDDRTHDSAVNNAHDMVKDFYLNRAGIPVLRYPTYPSYQLNPLIEAFKNKTADRNIPYPIFPVDVEVEEIYAYDDPQLPESEFTLENGDAEEGNGMEDIYEYYNHDTKIQEQPVKQSRTKFISTAHHKQQSKKHGIMQRLVFLFSGRLDD